MDKFSVASVTLKIIAIYVIILLLTNISTVVWILNTDAFDSSTGISLTHHRILIMLPFLLLLIVVGALFALNRSISWLLIDSDDADPPGIDDTTHPNQIVAFSVVGLFVIALALPEFLSSLFSILLAGGRIRGVLFSDRWPEILTEVLQLIVGIFLFLGARPLSEWWGRFIASTRPLRSKDGSDE